MALSAFDDKSHIPTDADLAGMLGRSKTLWDGLKAYIAVEYAPLTETWNFAGKQYGWSHRLIRKKRTVLYMIPCRKHFLVAIVLGDKAVRAAHESDLPRPILDVIDGARKYAEGRGIRLEVRIRKDLESIRKLAAIKMAN